MFWAGRQCRAEEVQNSVVCSILGLLCGAYALEYSGFKGLENTVFYKEVQLWLFLKQLLLSAIAAIARQD